MAGVSYQLYLQWVFHRHPSPLILQTGREWDQQNVRDTIQQALSRNIAQQADVGVELPPNHHSQFAFPGNNLCEPSLVCV